MPPTMVRVLSLHKSHSGELAFELCKSRRCFPHLIFYYGEKCFHLSKMLASMIIGERVGVVWGLGEKYTEEILEPEEFVFARDLF